MPSRETFTLPLLIVPHVVFPGVIATIAVRPLTAGNAARRAMEQDRSLVMALEVDKHEPVTTMATTARILDMDVQHDGWQIVAAGIQRAYIVQYRHHGESLVGQFRYVVDAEDTVPIMLIEEAWALASELWAMVHFEDTHPRLPHDAALLSFWIAAHVPLSSSTQQELLEIATTRGRLAKEISLMRTLLDGLRTEHRP